MFSIPDPVCEILNALESNGFQAYIVGGCVRDMLLKKAPKDWDICTNAIPETIIRIFGEDNTIPTGIKHGTITVKHDGMLCEVTTFRLDGKYTDSRHPDQVTFVHNIQDDLLRRDFTINAMAYNPRTGLIDPFGGQWDLRINHVIRAVGEPQKRFAEDPLRMLRALRFSSTIGFSIENDTYNSILSNLDNLCLVSKERIGSELRKIVCGYYAANALEYDDGKIIRKVIPELDAEIKCQQNNKYHYTDVFHHSINALKFVLDSKNNKFPREWVDEYVCMALLLHDIGKPESKTTDENGYDHFYGHAVKSADIAYRVLKRLRFSNKYIDTVVELIKYHDLTFAPTQKCVNKMLNKFGKEQLHRLLKIRECDNRAHSPSAYKKFATETVPFSEILEHTLKQNTAFSLKDLAINGNDVISIGVEEGPMIGNILKYLLNGVLEGNIDNNKDTLIGKCFQYLDSHNKR